MDFLKQFIGQRGASDEQLQDDAKKEWATLHAIIRKRRKFIGVIGLIFIILLPLLYLIFNIALFAVHWKDMQKPNREDFATLGTVLITFALFIPYLEDFYPIAQAVYVVGWHSEGKPGSFEEFED
jgi:hypothetical protein